MSGEIDSRPDDARSMRWPLAVGLAVLSALVVFFCLQVRGEWERVAEAVPPAPKVSQPTAFMPAPPAPAAASAPARVAWCAAPLFVADGEGHLFRVALQGAMHNAHTSARLLLGGSASLRGQAIGHYMGWSISEAERRRAAALATPAASGAASGVAIAPAGAHPASNPASTPACASRDCGAEQRMVGAMAREELARLAAQGNDAFAYALAHEACDSFEPGTKDRGSCQLISADQWAHLDPSNAVPWLAVAAQAVARGDDGAAREALHRVSTARRNITHRGALSAALLPHAPVGIDTPAPAAWLAMLAGLESARRPPPFSAIDLQCSARAVADANRRQVCDAVAHVFFDRADTLLARQFGLALGQRAGWPDDRVAAGRQTLQAWQQLQKTESPEFERLTCQGVPKLDVFLRQQAAAGEVAALRQALLASRLSEADLALRHRLESAPRELSAGDGAELAQNTPSR